MRIGAEIEREFGVLTDQECRAIVVQFAKGRGEKGISIGEYEELLKAAAAIRVQNMILDMVIEGKLTCEWDGQDFCVDIDKGPDKGPDKVMDKVVDKVVERVRECGGPGVKSTV